MSISPEMLKRTNIWLFALVTGFFAGFLFGLLKILEYYFRFTTVPIRFMVRTYFKPEFLETGWGLLIGWGVFTLMSIAVALIYALLLRKVHGPWAGFGIGLVIWGIIYWWLGPWLGWLEPAMSLSLDTLATDACLFLLWGAFIGYSISFEFTSDNRGDEPAGGQRKNLTNA